MIPLAQKDHNLDQQDSNANFKESIKHIGLYGLSLALLIFGLNWLKWKFLVLNHSNEIYGGIIALIFLGLGTWLGFQLFNSKKKTSTEEKGRSTLFRESSIQDLGKIEEFNLTKRELETLQLLIQGYSNSEIAEQLFLSLSTIKTHVSNLYTKMDVKNRYQAITRIQELTSIQNSETNTLV